MSPFLLFFFIEVFPKCNICKETFSNENIKKHHMESKQCLHESVEEVVCEECGQNFKNKHTLKKHIEAKHQEIKKFRCDLCDFQTSRGDRFKVHINDHKGIRPFKCSICDKTFKTKKVLENHEDTHLPDELKYKFTCQYCGSMFTKPGNLGVHIKSHHKNKK